MKRIILALFGLVFCSTNMFAQDAELLHYWNFEGDFMDQIGLAHGSVTATTTVTFAAGFDGNQAMQTIAEVTSDDDFVTIDSAQTTDPQGEAFSFSYWFNMTNDFTTDPRGIFDFSGDGDDGAQSLYIGNSDTLAFRVDGLGGGEPALFANFLEDSFWHFAVATYDPVTGIELHVDGSGVDATAGVAGTVNFAEDQYLGTFNFNDAILNKGLNGRLDDLAYYSGKLATEDIDGLFAGTLSPTDFAKNVLLGDVNCDGVVDLLDVQPFVALITGGGFSVKADINMDGVVDLLDVAPFVDLLTG